MGITIDFQNDHKSGLIKYIRKQHSNSIYDYIHVDYSSLLENDESRKPYGPLGIDNPYNNYTFHSQNINNSWYQVTVNYQIKPSSYSIQSYKWNYPSCWSLEASENGVIWDTLQTRCNDTELSTIQNYKIESLSYYSMFRFTSHGERHTYHDQHDFFLEIFHFELFGEIRPKNICPTLKTLQTYTLKLFIYNYILIKI